MNTKIQNALNASILIFIFSFIAAFAPYANADYQPNLLPGVYIENIDVGEYSAPVVYDWNGDGKKDLIIGSRTGTSQTGFHGYVNYYENIGSDSSPFFSSTPLQIQSCTSTALQ